MWIRDVYTDENGNDVILYWNGVQKIIDPEGEVTIVGTDGCDLIIGSRGEETIYGMGGDDIILARAGDDTIDGGSGSDIVLAGRGQDEAIYVFADKMDGDIDYYNGGTESYWCYSNAVENDTLILQFTDAELRALGLDTTTIEAFFWAENADKAVDFRDLHAELTLYATKFENIVVNVTLTLPTALDDDADVDFGSSVVIDLAANDSDPDGMLDLASIQITSAPLFGDVDIRTDGTIEYTHDGSNNLQDSLRYTILDDDGNMSNEATVNIEVNPANGSITGLVFGDDDVNGGLDSNEYGKENITILLRQDNGDGVYNAANDAIVDTVISDVNGAYTFSGLGAASYWVDVDNALLPLGFTEVTTLNDPQLIDMSTGAFDAIASDIGLSAGKVIIDVFQDLNLDGALEVGEPDAAGIAFNLYIDDGDSVFNSGDSLQSISPVITDSFGDAEFINLASGVNYWVVLDKNQTDPSLANVTSQNDPLFVDMTNGVSLVTHTVGVGYGAIAIDAFQDLNINGARDVGEPDAAGVAFNLYIDNGDNVFDSGDSLQSLSPIVTDATGAAEFIDLADGVNYWVVLDKTQTPASLANVTTLNNPLFVDMTDAVSLVTHTVGVGYGAIAIDAFQDLNINGARDVGEPDAAGVAFNLYIDNGDNVFDSGDSLQSLSPIVTDATGAAEFIDLADGVNYWVVLDKIQTPSSLANVTTMNDPLFVDMTNGTSLVNHTIGVGSGTVVIEAFKDLNEDGARDANEPDAPGVAFNLYIDNGDNVFDSNDSLQSVSPVITDVTGAAEFINLADGANYWVVLDTVQTPSAFANVTTMNDPLFVDMTNAVTIVTHEVGVTSSAPPGTGIIGGSVFNDVDLNAVQDLSELGIVGVDIELRDDLGDIVGVTVSDLGGNYQFDNLVAGDYTVHYANLNPALIYDTGPAVYDITLRDGDVISNADFGFSTAPAGSTNVTVNGRLVNVTIPDADELLNPGFEGTLQFQLTLSGNTGTSLYDDFVNFDAAQNGNFSLQTALNFDILGPELNPLPLDLYIDGSLILEGILVTTDVDPVVYLDPFLI